MDSLLPPTVRWKTLSAYAGMLLLTAALYLWIRVHGEALGPPALPHPDAAHEAATHSTLFAHVLFALATITLAARVVGGIFQRYLRQPPVIGEILAGLMLGPSLLGLLSPQVQEFVLPAACAPYISVIAKVGVVLFMFLVGLDLDPQLLRGNTHATVAISHASIMTPFLLGSLLALGLYPLYATSGVSFTVFSLFIGVSLSVTAFPVLARILTDRRVHRTRLGVTALTCAAVDDVTAWTLLAFVVGVANAQVEGVLWTVGLVLAYIALMFFVVRRLLRPFFQREQNAQGPLSHTALAIVFVALLLSALATEAIGIHALFGAFLLGALFPHDGRLPEQLRARLEDVVVVLFLPAFFAYTGMRTQIGLLSSSQDWFACVLIIAVATVGKFGGSYVAARLSGIARRKAAALGILMNTRGLMELIVLNIGLDLGVISPTVFTMLVIMAVVTTFATTPLLDRCLGKYGFSDECVAERSELPHARGRAR